MLLCICDDYQNHIFLEIKISLDIAQNPQFPDGKHDDHIGKKNQDIKSTPKLSLTNTRIFLWPS